MNDQLYSIKELVEKHGLECPFEIFNSENKKTTVLFVGEKNAFMSYLDTSETTVTLTGQYWKLPPEPERKPIQGYWCWDDKDEKSEFLSNMLHPLSKQYFEKLKKYWDHIEPVEYNEQGRVLPPKGITQELDND